MSDPSPAPLAVNPAYSEPLDAPGGPKSAWSGPVAVSESGCLLVSEAASIRGYSMSGNLLWTIAAAEPFAGWGLSGGSLYVQDRWLLAQYEIDALLRRQQLHRQHINPAPASAYDFISGQYWSSQDPAAPKFAEFRAEHQTALRFSAGRSQTTAREHSPHPRPAGQCRALRRRRRR